ncbi:hypothetical protein CJ179_37705 [Rhodococcus sp. ACS1]|nr:hypothetical protein CJ179_37705 [Rhodococcus sp. ACS1]
MGVKETGSPGGSRPPAPRRTAAAVQLSGAAEVRREFRYVSWSLVDQQVATAASTAPHPGQMFDPRGE